MQNKAVKGSTARKGRNEPRSLGVNQGNMPSGADSVRVRLKYFEAIPLSTVVSTTAQAWRLSSVFDPNLTGTGRQPNGYDEWSAFYARYRVWGGRWKIEVTGRDPNYNILVAAVERANDSLVDTNIYDIVQEPRAHFGVAGTRGSPTLVMSSTWYNPSILGVSAKEFLDQDYAAIISTNPSIQTYLCVRMSTSESETLSTDNTVYFTLEYDVEFYERINLDSSLFGMVKLLEEYSRTEDPRFLQLIKEDVKRHKEESKRIGYTPSFTGKKD